MYLCISGLLPQSRYTCSSSDHVVPLYIVSSLVMLLDIPSTVFYLSMPVTTSHPFDFTQERGYPVLKSDRTAVSFQGQEILYNMGPLPNYLVLSV